MKKFLWLFPFFVVSCSIESYNETFYDSYGVVKEDANTSGKLYVRSDKGKILNPASSSLLSNEDRDRRVLMRFTTSDDINSDTIKVNVFDFLKITQINFKSGEDTFISDEVYLDNIWVAQDYLTLVMDVMAASENSLKNHQYFMYSNAEVVNDTVRMEFKYDRKDDLRNINVKKVVALKLDDKIQSQDSVVLAIKYRTNRGATKEKHIIYRK
jgi:hypothetical protein